MLDDLHQHDSIEATHPVVLIGHRGLQQSNPFALTVAKIPKVECLFCGTQRSVRDIRSDNRREGRISDKSLHEGTFSAANISDTVRADIFQRRHHCFCAQVVKRRRSFRLVLYGGVIVKLNETSRRIGDHRSLMRKVSASNQLALRMLSKPSLASPNQLANFIVAHPIMLGVVENRQEHVKLVESICETNLSGQCEIRIARFAPRRESFVQWNRSRGHFPSERLEQA